VIAFSDEAVDWLWPTLQHCSWLKVSSGLAVVGPHQNIVQLIGNVVVDWLTPTPHLLDD
jgi:hypothetical protein